MKSFYVITLFLFAFVLSQQKTYICNPEDATGLKIVNTYNLTYREETQRFAFTLKNLIEEWHLESKSTNIQLFQLQELIA